MSCLLYPTELDCSGGHGCVLRGYTQQQRCSAPVWLQPQPLAQDAHQDLGDDVRVCRWTWAFIKFCKKRQADRSSPANEELQRRAVATECEPQQLELLRGQLGFADM